MHERPKTCCRLQKLMPNTCLSPNWCVLCKNSAEDHWHQFFNGPDAIACLMDLFRIFNLSWCFPNNGAVTIL